MKNIVLLLATIVICTGCGSGFGKKGDRNDWYFLMGQSTYIKHSHQVANLEYREQQIKTLQIVEAQLQQAVQNRNTAKIQHLRELKAQLIADLNKSSGAATMVMRRLKNSSSYVIEVTSGPFKGVTLNPGEETFDYKAVNLGKNIFDIAWEDTRNGDAGNNPITKIVTASSDYIEFTNQRKKRRRR